MMRIHTGRDAFRYLAVVGREMTNEEIDLGDIYSGFGRNSFWKRPVDIRTDGAGDTDPYQGFRGGGYAG